MTAPDLIQTTARVMTWNVWGRFGPWQARERALLETLAAIGTRGRGAY